MKVKLVTKYDVPVHEYVLDGDNQKNHDRIPGLGDHVEVDNERYMVVDRTFILKDNMVVIQLWQPTIDDPDYEEDKI